MMTATKRSNAAETVRVNWRDKPYQRVQTAADILDCSTGYIYQKINSGDLTASRIGGMTVISTESLVGFLATAEPWSPSPDRVGAAVAARTERANKRRTRVQSNTGGRITA